MRVALSSPWVRYFHEVEAFFVGDENIHVDLDNDEKVMTIYVNGDKKAAVLEELLAGEKNFGEVKLVVRVVPANKKAFAASGEPKSNDSVEKKLHNLFDGNVNVVEIATNPILPFQNLVYVVFQCKVLQYFSDDLGDLYGLESTLHEDVARDIFGDKFGGEVYFCTAPVSADTICRRIKQ